MFENILWCKCLYVCSTLDVIQTVFAVQNYSVTVTLFVAVLVWTFPLMCLCRIYRDRKKKTCKHHKICLDILMLFKKKHDTKTRSYKHIY